VSSQHEPWFIGEERSARDALERHFTLSGTTSASAPRSLVEMGTYVIGGDSAAAAPG